MDLFDKAIRVMGHAYTPYSKFKVGASILAADNQYYVGCNVENAAYPQGQCAEAGAIASMVAGGSLLISQVLVLADSNQLITPCGGCRQKLSEFSNNKTIIFLANLSGVKKELRLMDLLPGAFDTSFLSN